MPALAFDAAGAGGSASATAAMVTATWTHTASAGATVLVDVAYSASIVSTITDLTRTASYGGVAMASLGFSSFSDTGASPYVETFVLTNVAGGAQTVSVAAGASSSVARRIVGMSTSYTGVLSLGVEQVVDGSSSMSHTVTSASGQIVHQVFGTVGTISGYNQTSRFNGTVSGGPTIQVGDATGASTVAFSASTNGNFWSSIAIPLSGVSSLPSLTSFTAAGTYTYSIPSDATAIDVVVLGGGERGANGSPGANGGAAGLWNAVTLVRGVDIPFTTTTITGSVGQGGNQSVRPLATTASATGWAGISGGIVSGGSSGSRLGGSPGNEVFNGQTYVGGGAAAQGAAGLAPGGGSGAGSSGNSQPGAAGAAFIYAYSTIPKGTGSGAYGWIGHAVGKAGPPKSHGSGTYTWAGSARGKRPPKAHGVGGFMWQSTVTGDQKAHGVVSGAWGWVHSGFGLRLSKGHGAGSYHWQGSARSGAGGRSDGTYAWAGSAAGRTAPRGTSSGRYQWVYQHLAGIALHRLAVVPFADRSATVPTVSRGAAVSETLRAAVVPAAPRRATVPLSANRTTIVP